MDRECKRHSENFPWHYAVRRSNRAQRIRLNYTVRGGLELVLPRCADMREGLAFMETQRQWIESLAQRHKTDLNEPPSTPNIPKVIELKASGECYRIERGQQLGLREHADFLSLKAQPEQAPVLLQQWMKHKARRVLLPWLQQCSERTGLSYSRAGVRNQSSRWGSYSSRGSVSLNCRLLLLSPAEAEYVLLHELCHSKHMNHSAPFWRLLESVCPDALELDRAVDRAAKQMPDWICFKL